MNQIAERLNWTVPQLHRMASELIAYVQAGVRIPEPKHWDAELTRTALALVAAAGKPKPEAAAAGAAFWKALQVVVARIGPQPGPVRPDGAVGPLVSSYPVELMTAERFGQLYGQYRGLKEMRS
jgi:hypothetical protein